MKKNSKPIAEMDDEESDPLEGPSNLLDEVNINVL